MKADELPVADWWNCGEVVVGGDGVSVGVGDCDVGVVEVGSRRVGELRRWVKNAPSSRARQQRCLHAVVRSMWRIIGGRSIRYDAGSEVNCLLQ